MVMHDCNRKGSLMLRRGKLTLASVQDFHDRKISACGRIHKSCASTTIYFGDVVRHKGFCCIQRAILCSKHKRGAPIWKDQMRLLSYQRTAAPGLINDRSDHKSGKPIRIRKPTTIMKQNLYSIVIVATNSAHKGSLSILITQRRTLARRRTNSRYVALVDRSKPCSHARRSHIFTETLAL